MRAWCTLSVEVTRGQRKAVGLKYKMELCNTDGRPLSWRSCAPMCSGCPEGA